MSMNVPNKKSKKVGFAKVDKEFVKFIKQTIGASAILLSKVFSQNNSTIICPIL